MGNFLPKKKSDCDKQNPTCSLDIKTNKKKIGTIKIELRQDKVPKTVENFKTGLRCHTLADYCYGIQMALDNKFDRKYIRKRAEKLYNMYNVAKTYKYIFYTIMDVHNGNNGWYSQYSYIKELDYKE